MSKLSKYSHVLYRCIQIYAALFAMFYSYLGEYTRVIDQLLIFTLVSTLIRLTAHLNNVVRHNTRLMQFFHIIIPEQPEEAEDEEDEDSK